MAKQGLKACITVVVVFVSGLTSAYTGLFWHLTDVHVDPYYVVGSDTKECYCETYESCPRMGTKCNKTGDAGMYGNSQGNCASPQSLWESGIQFMDKESPSSPDFIFFTGDFAEAGASYACDSDSPARTQILDIINYDYNTLQKVFPETMIFSILGNHDSAPG